MTIRNTFIATLCVGLLFLAGCSEAPPSGEFSKGSSTAAAEGSATLSFQAEEKPLREQVPDTVPQEVRDAYPDAGDCVPEDAPPEFDDYKCVNAETVVSGVNFSALSDPGTETYSLWFNGSPDAPDLEIGSVVWSPDGTGSMADTTFGVDHRGYSQLQLRLSNGPPESVLVATALIDGNGETTFTMDEALTQVTFSATYTGNTANVALTTPEIPGATYVGWLVTADESGVLTHAEQFPLTPGTNTIEASMQIPEYAEFHVHIGDSKVNVAIGQIA